jgi:hypothetical protein
MQQTHLDQLARDRQREILADAEKHRRTARLSTPSDAPEENLSMFEWRRDRRWISLRIADITVR